MSMRTLLMIGAAVMVVCGCADLPVSKSKAPAAEAPPSAGVPPLSAAAPDAQNLLGLSVGPTSGSRGVTVRAVAPGSPCEGMVKPGETIFALTPNNQPGARVNMNNFSSEVAKLQPGTSVTLLLDNRTLRQVTCAIPTAPPSSGAPAGPRP